MTDDNGLTLSPTELAHALGIGRARVYRALKRGIIPSLRAGKKFRIPRRALDELLAHPERFDGEP